MGGAGFDAGTGRRRARTIASAVTAAAFVVLAACPVFAGSGAGSGSPAVGERELEARIASEEAEFRLVEVVSGLSRPWGLAFLPDGRALVTERAGGLYLIDLAAGDASSVSGLPPIAAGGQGGLLDVAVDPSYDDNSWVYFTYSQAYDGGTGTTLSRARLRDSALTDLEELFRMQPPGSGGRHFGSRIAFLPDDTIVISIGDRGRQDRAQDFQDHAGSLVRLERDGSIPTDNPFLDDPDVLDELYALGSRNAQGLVLHPETGVLWQHEHGPRGGDELNIIEAGNNYGWPEMSQGVDYRTGQPIGQGTEAPGMTQPIEHWTPAIAPSGMAFYFGDAFPGWRGNLFIGSLVDRHLLRLVIEDDRVTHQERLLDRTVGRVRDVRLGPDGYLYLLADEADSGVYRLEPVQ